MLIYSFINLLCSDVLLSENSVIFSIFMGIRTICNPACIGFQEANRQLWGPVILLGLCRIEIPFNSLHFRVILYFILSWLCTNVTLLYGIQHFFYLKEDMDLHPFKSASLPAVFCYNIFNKCYSCFSFFLLKFI
jgi:hypothetical protein